MSAALDWLAARRPATPAPLLEAMRALLAAGAPAGRPVPDTLADAALAALPEVAAAATRRDGALPLLAVDALITAACEAAAEAGPDAVVAMLGRLEPGRFAAALDAAAGP